MDINTLLSKASTVEEELKLLVGLLFELIIFLSFIYGTIPGWLFERRDSKRAEKSSRPRDISEIRKEPTKIIGGLGVLLVALIANDPWVYAVSLFIGGLLIASERFMVSLAAIFNSDRKTVAEIPRLWDALGSHEISERQAAEAKREISERQAATGQTKQQTRMRMSLASLIASIRALEKMRPPLLGVLNLG